VPALHGDAPPEWKSPPGLPGFTDSIQTPYGCGAMNRLYHEEMNVCQYSGPFTLMDDPFSGGGNIQGNWI
jgi:hypothetical protein